jgi:putative transcriptional regulator
MKKPSKPMSQPSLGEELIAGLKGFAETLEAGTPIESRYTVQTVTLDLETKPYSAQDLKAARKTLNVSQAILAKFLGVSVKTVSAWEQGAKSIPTIACRYLDDILADPQIFYRRVRLIPKRMNIQ